MSRLFIGLAVVVGLLSWPASQASANGVPMDAYVVWDGQGPAQYVAAPLNMAYNNINAAIPAAVKHDGLGRYLAFFPGLDLSDGELRLIAHARARGAAGSCAPDQMNNATVGLVAGGQVRQFAGRVVRVYCFNTTGDPADLPFTASLSGKTDTGGLVYARFDLTNPAAPLTYDDPLFFYASTGVGPNKFSVTPGAFGQYAINLPYLPESTPPTFLVTAEPWHFWDPFSNTYQVRPVHCGITGKMTYYASWVQQLIISCVDSDGNPSAVKYLDVTYARGINTLGQKVLNTSYADVPLLTTPISGYKPFGMNVIYGVPGAITVDRTTVGWYIVHLEHLNWGTLKPSITVTPKTASARCWTATWTTSTEATVEVFCRNGNANYVDTGFYIQYVTRG